MSSPNSYSVTARATVTVTDVAALVAQLDELVALTDEFEPLEEGTFWDGWEDREGTGYRGPGDAHYLDDDLRAMINLAIGLASLQAKGVAVDADGWVDGDFDEGDLDTGAPFEVVLNVDQCEITKPRSATGWLGALTGVSPTLLQARVAVKLLEAIAGVTVEITEVVAEQGEVDDDFELEAPEAEITLVPGGLADELDLPPADKRIVVVDGGSHYETDGNGFLVNRPTGYPADTSCRAPLRFDGATAERVVHFMHPIPVGRGFAMRWVLDNAPGWDFNGLSGALRAAGLVERPPGAGTPRVVKGLRWVDIEPSGIASRVELDPAAFTRPAPGTRRHRQVRSRGDAS